MRHHRELKTILYVEDEIDIQKIVRLALQDVAHLEVEISGSGREALEAIKARVPDLILLDAMMPGMDGPTTLRALREIPRLVTVPIVFMTAKAQAADITRFRNLGATDVLTKPFDPMTLGQRLRDIWDDHWRQMGS